MAVGLVDEEGCVLHSYVEHWRSLEKDSVINTVINAARRYLNYNPVAVGVNIPGLADAQNGIWLESCFSGISNIPIVSILSNAFKLPVFIDNDVNNCALAENMFGACQNTSDFIWLTVSNGCGGALFLNGRVYNGVRNTAGELGHITVEQRAEYALLCGCGNRGCLEAQAAGPGIAKRYFALTGRNADAESVADMANSGDTAAQKVYNDEGVYIGRALAAVINTITPQKVILGGGVVNSFELFEPSMTETIQCHTYRLASQHVRVEKTYLGYYAALIGAASIAISNTKKRYV